MKRKLDDLDELRPHGLIHDALRDYWHDGSSQRIIDSLGRQRK
jgi:hypothetical protein